MVTKELFRLALLENTSKFFEEQVENISTALIDIWNVRGLSVFALKGYTRFPFYALYFACVLVCSFTSNICLLLRKANSFKTILAFIK